MTIYSDDPIEPDRGLSLPIALMGYGGLVPFFAGAIAVWLGLGPVFGIDPLFAVQAYGAVILSFLGGIRWGLALSPTHIGDRERDIMGSVIPSLVAWGALLLPSRLALTLLIVGFISHLLWDLKAHRDGAIPDWFRNLRVTLTTGAVISLVLILPSLA